MSKVLTIVNRIQKVGRESQKNSILVLFDFIKARKEIKLSFSEYENYKWAKQPEIFRKTFLPYALAVKYWQVLNPPKYACLARDKYLSHLLLETRNIPTSELYVYYNPEFAAGSSDLYASDYDDIVRILKAKKVESFVVKPSVDSAHGQGVVVCHQLIETNDGLCVRKYDGSLLPLKSLVNKKPLLFESVIVQNEQMQSFNSSSTNTIRFMSALYPDKSVKVFAAFLKIGRAGSDVDNAGSGGNVDCGVNVSTGKLYNVMQFDSWDEFTLIDSHPDSNQLLNSVEIKGWHSIVEAVKTYQGRIPELKTIGWDVAVTADGPCIIEINNWWDTTGQLFLGEGWKAEVEACHSAWEKYYKKDD